MIDIAVVGAGPAGLSAAINGVARNKNVVVFGKKISTSPLYRAERVDNYLGMNKTGGAEMISAFYNHALEMGVKIQEGRVLQIMPMDDSEPYFVLNVDNEFFNARTVILAVGVGSGKTIDGEEEYLGRGVSYCATCDGMLYRGTRVVVVSDTDEGEADANFLAEVAEVLYIPKYKTVGTLDERIEVIQAKPLKVTGTEFVSGLETDKGVYACDGVFFIKNVTPVSNIVYGLKMDVETNAIEVNRRMETNIAAIYAAGDCTGRPLQIAKAVGEGLIAAQSAVRHIDSQRGDKNV